jgi:hypothetical protein
MYDRVKMFVNFYNSSHCMTLCLGSSWCMTMCRYAGKPLVEVYAGGCSVSVQRVCVKISESVGFGQFCYFQNFAQQDVRIWRTSEQLCSSGQDTFRNLWHLKSLWGQFMGWTSVLIWFRVKENNWHPLDCGLWKGRPVVICNEETMIMLLNLLLYHLLCYSAWRL